jgi:hypothetical protein
MFPPPHPRPEYADAAGRVPPSRNATLVSEKLAAHARSAGALSATARISAAIERHIKAILQKSLRGALSFHTIHNPVWNLTRP